MLQSSWFKLIRPFAIVFLAIQLLTRIGLLVYSHAAHEMSAMDWPRVFGWGLLFDLEVLGFFLLPIVVPHMLMRHWNNRGPRITRFVLFAIFTYICLFTAVSEYFFWEEFGTRFNFIAVDYLIYTTEVIGNIKESYPLYPLLAAIAALTLLLTFWFRKCLSHVDGTVYSKKRYGLALVAFPVVMFFALSLNCVKMEQVQALEELATNGTYDLFYAFQHNELDYKGFYATRDEKVVTQNIRQLLFEKENTFVSKDPADITRIIKMAGPELHKNVILVAMESMGSDFMGQNGVSNLTPNLDALTKKGYYLSNLYATGTRTVRGLEALTLSVPPTPGQSIVRRPGNENLFSLGFIFQDRGYDTKFIYGGHGYFDNMNAFFEGNGFKAVDRMDFADSDVTFSNVWGVCDEDLYNQVIKQADMSYKNKKPFMDVVMTTSNHRPYTYPSGKIDIPSKTGGRSGGVKYADYAVGQFLKAAEKKPWFKDTVFIFVADHTAGAAGKIELSPKKYHIPAIFYAPGFIKPKVYPYVSSQIDIAPTLLGMLNFSYYTKFYGEDLVHDLDEPQNAHAFISSYQKVGLLKNDELTILEPQRKTEYFKGETEIGNGQKNQSMLLDTITYYQYASGWKERMKRVPTVVKK